MRSAGILLPGKGSRTGFDNPATVRVVAGSKIIVDRREKSPCLKAAVGTVILVKAAAPFIDVRWISKKKNVLFFRIGPPTVPPYWFCRRFGTVWAKKLPAFSASLRQNSNSVP